MHPKQICTDIESLGSSLTVEGNNLYIENPENILPEIEDLIKSYKPYIIKFLQGDYSDKEHSVKQTIQKIINYFLDIEQAMDKKIDDWLRVDNEALQLIMKLLIKLWENGWTELHQPIANYENELTDKLSLEIFNRAMAHFKKGA